MNFLQLKTHQKFLPKSMRIVTVFVLFLGFSSLLANSPDRAFCEKILEENRYFLTFLNSGISNFAKVEHIQVFHSALEEHYQAHKAYLSGHYKVTHRHIRNAHLILKDLYAEVIDEYYIVDTQNLLERNSAMIIESRDVRAEHFMRLGYRDLKVAEIYKNKGFAHNKEQYSTKIYFYIDAIKYARQAKRYAFLAIIESQTPHEDKDNFKKQTYDDFRDKSPKEKQSDFERVKNKLTNMIHRRLIVDQSNYFIHLFDNYDFIVTQKKNQFDSFFKGKWK